MAGIYSQGGSAGHRYAGWLSEVEAKNFTFGGKVFNGSPSAIYVGSNQVWFLGWLSKATKQAIVGAFGQTDGTAVINATNAYLNQLAASDRDKATALAGFINEDYLLVCELPSMPSGISYTERSTEISNEHHIDTGIYASSDVCMEIDINLDGNLFIVINGGPAWQRYSMTNNANYSYLRFDFGNTIQNNLGYKLTGRHIVKMDGGVLSVDGNVKHTFTDIFSSSDQTIKIGANASSTVGYKQYLYKGKMWSYSTGTLLRDMIPTIQNGQIGVIDLVNMEFLPSTDP